LPEKSYAAHCEFTYENLKPAIIDIFFISHFIGWVLKALMLRDTVLCWVISISWEFVEILLTHMLPNFAECWWDQWILDVLLTNGLGIYAGTKLGQWLEIREYKWSGVRYIPTISGKIQRLALQFTPASWTTVRWETTKNIKRFLSVHFVIFVVQLEELNAFFMKQILWVPPPCPLNVIRLFIWYVVGVPCLRQLYSYITDPTCKKIGTFTFLGAVTIVTELLIIFKFGAGEFNKPMPDHLKQGLMIFSTVYGLICIAMMFRIHARSRADSGADKHSE